VYIHHPGGTKTNSMSPKDKAKQLKNKFGNFAIDVVDEIIQFGDELNIREPMMYWEMVKRELNQNKDEL